MRNVLVVKIFVTLYLERSRSLAARYPIKVAVTFSSGMVLDMSLELIRIGTPPNSVT